MTHIARMVISVYGGRSIDGRQPTPGKLYLYKCPGFAPPSQVEYSRASISEDQTYNVSKHTARVQKLTKGFGMGGVVEPDHPREELNDGAL
jgi:hypothetical protein